MKRRIFKVLSLVITLCILLPCVLVNLAEDSVEVYIEPVIEPGPEPKINPEPDPNNNEIIIEPDPDPDPTTPEPAPPTTNPGNNDDPDIVIIPATDPTEKPDPDPTEEPDPDPTEEPDPEPTEEPNPEPTEEPDPDPTEEPGSDPTEEPGPNPTNEPNQNGNNGRPDEKKHGQSKQSRKNEGISDYSYLFTSASNTAKYELRNEVKRVAAYITNEGNTKSLVIDCVNHKYYIDGTANILSNVQNAQKKGTLTPKLENAVLGILSGTAWPENGEGASNIQTEWGIAIEKEDGIVHYSNAIVDGDIAVGMKETISFLNMLPW